MMVDWQDHAVRNTLSLLQGSRSICALTSTTILRSRESIAEALAVLAASSAIVTTRLDHERASDNLHPGAPSRTDPLYFFDTADETCSHRDEAGTACAAPGEIQRLAVLALLEMAASHAPGPDVQTATIRVRDAVGIPVYTVTLRLNGRWASHSPH